MTSISSLPPGVRQWLLVAVIATVNVTLGLFNPGMVGFPYLFAVLSAALLVVALTRAFREYRRAEAVGAAHLTGQNDRRG